MATLASGHSLAQSAVPQSDTEVSKEIENPVTRRITVPLRYEADFLDGPYKATKDTFSIDQAVVPFRLNEDWALITRTKLPGERSRQKSSAITGPAGFPMDTRHSFCRQSMVRVFTGAPARFSIIPRRPTPRSASTNGAPVRRRPS
jgi:hypothetical protein